MQSSSRAAGGGRTPDDGNWPDQARIEHSAQIHTHTNAQIHTHTYVHKYTSTQLHLLIKPGLITLLHSVIGKSRGGEERMVNAEMAGI